MSDGWRRLLAAGLAAALALSPPVALAAPPAPPADTGRPAAAAHIVLDKPVRAGELTVFPDLGDPKSYYYISDQPRLATDDSGRPQFSFLRWVDNVRSGAKDPEAREGEGGGLVHAVVALSVTPDQVREAQRDLQRKRPGARIVGSVPFTAGTFGLVSSFKDPKTGNLSSQVVGLGKAPLLDGEKAAVSILLTKQGAKILWESFETPTPDISFTFEMELAGYRSPLQAKVEADWDQIYEHEAFAAGFATSYLAGEVKATFDDLRRSGAIRVTQVGEDEKLQGMVDTAYGKLTELMFSKVESLDPAQLAKAAGGESLMEKASDRLQAAKKEADAINTKREAENRARRERNEKRDQAKAELAAQEDKEKAEKAEKEKPPAEPANPPATPPPADKAPGKDVGAPVDVDWEKGGGDVQPPPEKPPTADPAKVEPPKPPVKKPPAKPPGKLSSGKGSAGRGRVGRSAGGHDADDKKPPGGTAPKKPPGGTAPQKPPANKDPAGAAKDEKPAAGKDKPAGTTAGQKSDPKSGSGASSDAERERLAKEPKEEEIEEVSPPSFAVLATYELRKVRQQGRFVLDFNKYLADTMVTRFDENIGDLRRLKQQGEHFRQVNLDDPLYKQREIVAMVDGYDAKDFGEWINFVTVQLRKKHAGGAETTDEVRIDRKNFNSEGNAFKLLYGWNGDQDRRRWLDYEVKTSWNFFGGHLIEQPWRKANAGAIGLAPPFERHRVTLQGDLERLREAEVRAITAKIFYSLGGGEQVKQVSLNVDREETDGMVEFLLPAGQLDYGYEVVWRLAGNRVLSSGRQTTSSAILFVDELPPG